MKNTGTLYVFNTSSDKLSNTITNTDTLNHFGPQSKNLASIMRGFKSAIIMQAKTIRFDFAWQPRYYDHIIRNSESFETIQNYIIDNPLNWTNDQFYK
jgi:putative transposase